MRSSTTSSRYKALSLLVIIALVLSLASVLGGQVAAAEEVNDGEPLSGLLAFGSEGSGRSQVDGSAREASLVADILAGKPTWFVNQVVSLDGDASVLGSFTVDGMTYAVTGDGAVEFVAVTSGVLAGDLAIGSSGASFGEGSGSGVPPRSVAGQAPSGAASPSPSLEGEPSDDAEDGDASEPVALEVPESVEYDGIVYSVTSIGPRALAGCDADVVRVPASVASVDEAAFRGSAVGGVEVAESNPDLASYEGVLYDAGFKSLLLIPEGKKGVVRIHSNASAITPGALSHCASVTSVEVDAGNEAFYVEDGALYDMSEGALVALTARSQERFALQKGIDWKRAVPDDASGDLSSEGEGTVDLTNRSMARADKDPLALGSNIGLPYNNNIAIIVDRTSRYGHTDSCSTGTVELLTYSSLTDDTPNHRLDGGGSVSFYCVGLVKACQRAEYSFFDIGSSITVQSQPWEDPVARVRCTACNKFLVFKYISYPDSGRARYLTGSCTGQTNYDGSLTPPTRVVTWNANGGSVTPTSSTVNTGSTVKSPVPKRAGYTCTGWWTAATGGIKVCAAGAATPAISANVTYYARWSAVSYTITYTLGGGAITEQKASYTIETANFALAKPTRGGYTFSGWTVTGASGAGIATSGTTTTVKKGTYGNLAATAKWAKVSYPITYVLGGGSITGQKTGYDVETASFALAKPTRAGYSFSGWTVAGASGAGVTTSGTTTTVKKGTYGNLTATAKWSAVSYSIAYALGGGSLSGQRTTYTIETANFALAKPTRGGYTFTGWTVTGASGAGIATSGTTTTVKKGTYGNLVATARWKANSYEVSFDANSGAGGQSASVTAIYDAAMPTISTTPPVRAGYAFGGWWDASESTGGTQYYTAAGASARAWNKVAAATLYARWEVVPYAIAYDAAGGELAAGARGSYTVEDAFDLLTPTRYGYQFDGWDVSGVAEGGAPGPVLGAGVEDATAPDGSKVTRVMAGTYGDLSCTAKWTLRYDLDVPVADPGSVTFEADSVTGQVRVKPGTSADGELRSYMAVPVALDSLACEGLGAGGSPDPAGGAPELEAIFGAGSASKVRFAATLGEGDAARTAKLTAGGPSATASLAGLSIPAASSHDAPGRIKVSYGLELDSDLPIPPVRDAAPVARLSYMVSLPGAGA